MSTKHTTIKDIPLQENLASGTTLCAGCGGVLLVRILEKMLGPGVVTVNAAGCMSMISVYPYTPFKSSWFYVAMPSAPAAAQGIRDALDILIEKKRISQEQDLKVLVVTGDGAAADIGLQSTSGALHRKLDFYYLVYDNEAYSNTGFQASGSSPYGSNTKTTSPGLMAPQGLSLEKKDLFEIWRAHRPPYIATVSPGHISDMMHKVETASGLRGPKLFLALSPCPPGWSIDSDKAIRISKMAVDTGVWPLKEAVDGRVKHTVMKRDNRMPVEEYLKMQGRFEHLFYPARQENVLESLQKKVDDYWAIVSE